MSTAITKHASGCKGCGEVFPLLVPRGAPDERSLWSVARMATFAENAIWRLWFLHDPVRELLVWAPLDQEAFLYMQPAPMAGRPWRERIEDEDLLGLKRRDERRRMTMGRHYSQSDGNRVEQKAKDAGLTFADFADLYTVKATLSPMPQGDTHGEVVATGE